MTSHLRLRRSIERKKKKIAGRIAMVRGDRSQREFARQLGIFQQNVSRYELGLIPHCDFLMVVAMKEKVSIDWLLTGKGEMRAA